MAGKTSWGFMGSSVAKMLNDPIQHLVQSIWDQMTYGLYCFLSSHSSAISLRTQVFTQNGRLYQHLSQNLW